MLMLLKFSCVINYMRWALRKILNVGCDQCGHVTRVPVQRFYDGYEGAFVCNGCGAPLENICDALEED